MKTSSCFPRENFEYPAFLERKNHVEIQEMNILSDSEAFYGLVGVTEGDTPRYDPDSRRWIKKSF